MTIEGTLETNSYTAGPADTATSGSFSLALGTTAIATVSVDGDGASLVTPAGWTAHDTITSSGMSVGVYSRAGAGASVEFAPTTATDQDHWAIQVWLYTGVSSVVQSKADDYFDDAYSDNNNGFFIANVQDDQPFRISPMGTDLFIEGVAKAGPEVVSYVGEDYSLATAWSRTMVTQAQLELSSGYYVMLELENLDDADNTFPCISTEISPTYYGYQSLTGTHWIDKSDNAMDATTDVGSPDGKSLGPGSASIKLNTQLSTDIDHLSLPNSTQAALTFALGEVFDNESVRIRASITSEDWLIGKPIYVGTTKTHLRIDGGYLIAHYDGTDYTAPKRLSFTNGDLGFVEVIATITNPSAVGDHLLWEFNESYDGRNWHSLGNVFDDTVNTLVWSSAAFLIKNETDSAANTTKVHSVNVGIIDITASTRSQAVTKWLLTWDFASTGLQERLYGMGTLVPTGAADIDTDRVSAEPGWFIRVRASHTGDISIPLFVGQITNVKEQPQLPDNIFTDVAAVDLTEALASVENFHNTYAKAVLASSPIAYWKLDDSGAIAVDSSGTGADGYYSSGAQHAAGLVDGLPGSSLELSKDGTWVRSNTVKRLSRDEGFAIEFWIKTKQSPLDGKAYPIIVQSSYAALETGTGLILTKEGFLFMTGNLSGTTSKLVGTPITDGKPHHIVCNYVAGSDAYQVYVDGVQATVTNSDAGNSGLWALFSDSQTILGYNNSYSLREPLVGFLDDVAIYRWPLSGWQVRAHYYAGTMGTLYDTLDERIETIWTANGLDESMLSIHSSATTTNIYTNPVYNTNVTTELATIAESVGATIQFNAKGTMSVYGYDYFPAPVATFSDVPGAALPYQASGFSTALERSELYNYVSAQVVDGATQVASDPSSIAKYGRRSFDLGTIRAVSDGEALAAAERFLDTHRLPRERFKSISVRPQGESALWTAIAQLQLSRVATITFDSDTDNYTVEGIRTRISPKFWETSYYVTESIDDDFWRWGDGTPNIDARWA